MYFGNFSNENDICTEFRIDAVNGVVLFAAYELPDYEGYADVVFAQDGKLYHVSGSHCSCFGLEEQWQPEEMPITALRHMAEKGYNALATYRAQVLPLLDELEAMGVDQEGVSPDASQDAIERRFR